MSTKKILVNSPILNELTFDYLFTMNVEQRKRFSPKELRYIRTAKRARQFVSKATIDEKLLILAKLGVGFSFILHKEDRTPKHLKEWYEKYKAMTKGEFVEEMANEKFVVLTDRILVGFLNIMGNFSHSDSYMLNLDYHKVGYFVNNWKKYDRPDVETVQESLEYAKVINRLSLNMAVEMKSVKGATEIGDLDLILLMYLQDNRGKYISRETIMNTFGMLYRKMVIGAAIKRLFDKVFIERNPMFTQRVEYQITGLGSLTIMEFHTKNLRLTV